MSSFPELIVRRGVVYSQSLHSVMRSSARADDCRQERCALLLQLGTQRFRAHQIAGLAQSFKVSGEHRGPIRAYGLQGALQAMSGGGDVMGISRENGRFKPIEQTRILLNEHAKDFPEHHPVAIDQSHQGYFVETRAGVRRGPPDPGPRRRPVTTFQSSRTGPRR
jgi:hypothetical protein